MAQSDNWWARDVAAAGGPTAEERKSEAGIASTEAGTARTRGLTPAEIRKANAEALLAEFKLREAKAAEDERLKKEGAARKAEGTIAAGLADTIAAAAAAREKSKSGLFATGFGATLTKGIDATPASDVAGLLATVGNKTAIDQLQELKAAGTALTPVSNTDIELLKNSIASLDQAQSDAEFQRSMDVILKRFMPIYKRLGGTPDVLAAAYETRTGEKLAPGIIPGMEAPKAPPSGAPPSPLEGRGEATELRTGAGDKYVTEEDKRAAARLQDAFDKGASAEELNALAGELGVVLSPEQVNAAIQFREKGGTGALIRPKETERPLGKQLIGAAAESPVGAYAIGAGSALTGGTLDELAGLAGGPEAEQRARFAREFSQTESPWASTLGEITGAGLASIPAIRGARALMPGVSATRAAMAGEAALGAATGAGEADEGSRLAGAALGGTLGAAAGAVPGAIARVAKPRTPEAVSLLRKAGVRDMSLGQVLGAPELEAGAAGVLPGGGDVALRAQRKAFEQFQESYLNDALKNIGVEIPKGLKPTKRVEAAQKAFDAAYERARSNMQVIPDANMWRDLMSFNTRLGSDEFSEQAASRLQKLLRDQIQRRINGPISGDEYKSLASLLGKRRAAFAKRGDAEMADGVAELQRIIDSAARRHSPPEAVQLMDQADKGYAILTRAEEAARNLGNAPGEFTPQQALAASRKGDITARNRAFVRGEARGQQLAEAGVEALGKAPPTAPSRVERGIGFTGSALGAPVSLPLNVGLGIANAPGVRQVLNTAIAGERPAAVQGIADFLRAKPEYAAVPASALLQASRDRPEDITDLRRRYGLEVTPPAGWADTGGY